MLTTTQPAPKANSDRIIYLDILRGMAILFIFLANSQAFAGLWSLSPEVMASFPTATLDHLLDLLLTIFIDGKWYSVFSILFGIGFAVQLQSMRNNLSAFPAFFRRRMLGLLLIGSVHLFLLWPGDILTLYALIGFVLIVFRNCSDRRLIAAAIVLLCLPLVNWMVINVIDFNYVDPVYGAFFAHGAAVAAPEEFSMAWLFENSSFLKFFQATVGLPLVRLAYLLESGRFFKVLALFLLGLWAGRAIFNRDLLNDKKVLTRIVLWCGLIGLPMNFLRAYAEFGLEQSPFSDFLYELFYGLGTVPLACAYAALLALALPKFLWFFKIFAPVGRMALSNYLAQTVISITIFYGIGFGFARELGLSIVWAIALGIYALQIVFSTVWLSHFQYGPVEWLWRQLTYGQVLPIRKKKALPVTKSISPVT